MKALESEARRIAETLRLAVDRPVYEGAKRDPFAPLLYGGELDAPLGFFGRDPGRKEIEQWQPLIGTSGQRVRKQVESRGKRAFYANTVPYKPVGNKAWGEKIIHEFHGCILELLVDEWKGSHLMPLGTEAFAWFTLECDAETRERLEAHWESEGRYTNTVETLLTSPKTGTQKKLTLMPLPHPSPLNVRWFKKFPDLLDQRFAQISRTSSSA